MPNVETLSPETVYLTKGNIRYPGTSAQATAAQTLANARLVDALGGPGNPNTVAVTESTNPIVVAT